MKALLMWGLGLVWGVRWYALAAVGILGLAGSVTYSIYNSGAKHEELKQVHETIIQHQKVQTVEKTVDSYPTSDARKRLLGDWGRR